MQFSSSARAADENFDYLFKIILIGDSNVGKTCVVQHFKSGVYMEAQQNTIGVDFTVRAPAVHVRVCSSLDSRDREIRSSELGHHADWYVDFKAFLFPLRRMLSFFRVSNDSGTGSHNSTRGG